MDVTPIDGSFALEVRGVELWRPLDPRVRERLRDLWSRGGVLVFRRQALSEDELVVFSAAFGELERIVRSDWRSRNRPEITHISNLRDGSGNAIGGLGAGELGWHSDQSYMCEPATGSVLYMVEMPREGGVTYWANLRLAYAALPAATRRRIEGREAIYDYLVRQSTYDDEPPMSAQLKRETPRVAHPLVNAHPVTGERSLYLDPTTTAGVAGLSDAEGRALLERLNVHATDPRFVYTHRWQIGDVVMWDNGLTLHRRDPFDPASLRLLKRTTLRLPSDCHIVPAGRLVD